MKPLLLVGSLSCALLSACIDGGEGERDGHGGHDRGATLPSDAYYVGVPLPYRSVADCLAGEKLAAACTHEVALCASGAYGVRDGDVVTAGNYRLAGHHAVSSGHHGDEGDGDDDDDDDGESLLPPAFHFDFDVEAGQLVVGPATGGAALGWAPDYDGRWKTTDAFAVDCAARPPRR